MTNSLSARKKRTAIERIYRVRLANLSSLVKAYGSQAQLARALAISDAFLTQMVGPSPCRSVGEKLARDIEQKLGLYSGWMDMQH